MTTIDLSKTEQRSLTRYIRDTEDREILVRLIDCVGMNAYIRSTLDQGCDLTYEAYNADDDTNGWTLGTLALAAGDVAAQEEEEEFGNHPYIYIKISCDVAPTGGNITIDFYGKDKE